MYECVYLQEYADLYQGFCLILEREVQRREAEVLASTHFTNTGAGDATAAARDVIMARLSVKGQSHSHSSIQSVIHYM